MAITLNGTTGITTPDIDSTAGFDGEDLTGDVAAARITGIKRHRLCAYLCLQGLG